MKQMPANYQRLEGSEIEPAQGGGLVGPSDSSETITVSLCLRQRPDGPPLPGHAYWIATPPGKHKFLSTDEFAAKHGASQKEVEKILQFARSHDLKVLETSLASWTLDVQGSVEGKEVQNGRQQAQLG
jgi:hypothetical protein